MLRDDSSESELRIRLEGRVEQVELLLARWDDVHDALRGSGWSIDESRLEIETSAGDQQALVRVSESPAGRRLVRQLETSLKRTNALAAKMLRELALPVLPGANALADLRSHLPLRYKTESASAPMAVAVAAGGAAIVVGLAVASWSGDAGGLGCLALFGLVFAVAFSAAWAKRESFVVITQRMLAVRSIAIPLSEIVSVQVEEYVNGDGKGNGTSNMRFVGLDGRSTEIHYRGDPKRVTAVLETLGIATAAATLLEPASSSEG